MDIFVEDDDDEGVAAIVTASGVDVPEAEADVDVLVLVVEGSVPNLNVFALASNKLSHHSTARSRSFPSPFNPRLVGMARGFFKPDPPAPSRGTPVPPHPWPVRYVTLLSGMLWVFSEGQGGCKGVPVCEFSKFH